MVRQNIQKRAYKVEIMARDVRDLENGAYSPGDELCSSVDALLSVLNENWDFPRALGFQYLGKLRYCLLQNLGRADIDFSDDDHDGYVESQGNTEMLFRHADEAVIGSNHEKAIVGLAGEETKDSGTN